MHEEDLAIVKALVPMAWADGVFADKEKEALNALLDVVGATDEEKAALHAYAEERRTLDDINLQDLSADDRRAVLQHAVLLSYVDGHQGPEEKKLLDELVAKLKIPLEEATPMIAAASERAKKHLALLG
jgi:tellurite resistance protein